MSVQELESKLNAGSRQNRYQLLITVPSGVSSDTDTWRILCQSASVPGDTRGVIEIMRDGSKIRLAGDSETTAELPISIQVPSGSDASLVYGAFYEWKELCGENSGYKTKIKMNQLDLDNSVAFSWDITGAWVSELPSVEFSSESVDTIQTFDVSLTVDKCVPA